MDEREVVKQFIVQEFLTDVPVEDLDDEYDLLSNGVIDSLGLLRLVAWLEQRFELAIDDMEIAPENFQTVLAIVEFMKGSAGSPIRHDDRVPTSEAP